MQYHLVGEMRMEEFCSRKRILGRTTRMKVVKETIGNTSVLGVKLQGLSLVRILGATGIEFSKD